MGDFEDQFGAGADADGIISSNNAGYSRSTWVQKARWFGEPSQDQLDKAIARDEFDAWSKSMAAKGYIRGPQFETHDKLKEWDTSNKRPHIRIEGYGGYTVFFTDGQPYERPNISESQPWMNDPDIPF